MNNNSVIVNLPEIVGGGYSDFWKNKTRYEAVKGSRRSKKSTTTALRYITRLLKYPLANLCVVRRVGLTNRDSTYAQLKWAIDKLKVSHLFKCTISPLEMEIKGTGQKILFRGFDDPAKLASITTVHGAMCWYWVEEAFEIEDENDFNQWESGLSGSLPDGYFRQITLTFNPWLATHWLKRRFFDEPNDDVFALTTTWRCNEFLSERDKAEYERIEREEPQRAKVICLGEWGLLGVSIFDEELVAARINAKILPTRTGVFTYKFENIHGGQFDDIKFAEQNNGYVKIYKDVIPGHPYVIGADTAGEGADYFAAQVIDNSTGEQVAVLRQKFDADLFAKQLYCLGKYYNTALIAPENNFAPIVVVRLQDYNYPNMYVTESLDRFDGKMKKMFGFRTGAWNRELIIGNLVEIFREHPQFINDEDTLNEMLTFTRTATGRAEAAQGAHDDLVMALAIALECRSQQTHIVRTPTRTEEKPLLKNQQKGAGYVYNR
ncbi:MAG: PBSX family phage terminase large subunit [Oscillospiraceae bacterium]|jgi:phage terminase large subunit|nr:PBSX family phage terminase large subunit [Oscillospiraceae bacterium]